MPPRQAREQQPGLYTPFIILRAADTPIGVLFRAFARINPKSGVKGTGLGLHLCQKLADLISGRIEFESEFGRGSRFTLLIPRVESGERKS
jgi:signal transduction histidine kinase